MNLNIKSGTIIRTVLLILALINQFLSIMGISPLPIEDEQLTEFISLGFTIATSVWAWWKNNSFTRAAVIADEYLESVRGENK